MAQKQGQLLGHDYGPRYPDVAQAVHEIFGKPEAVSGTVWKVTKR